MPYQIELHQRVTDQPHSGQRCERLSVRGNGGTSIYIAHEIGRPLVIDELLPTVWIRSDRSGLQLLAEVVLPRTQDPRTGRPVSTLIAGSSYTNVGSWQQLRLEGVPRLVTRQARVLRTEMGPRVDEREAYLTRLVLNVYGGPGATNVWIDDLEITGYVPRPEYLDRQDVAVVADAPGGPGQAMPVSESLAAAVAPPGTPEPSTVEMAGSVLLASGRPLFPRIIQYRGEPLSFLKRLGFNAIWVDVQPSTELLNQVSLANLWIVCPPPPLINPVSEGGPVVPANVIGPQYRRVLAWDLGRGLFSGELESTRRWAEQVRAAERHGHRPLIAQAEGDLRMYSRYVDLLLFGRQPAGSSLELIDYATWLRGRPLLARPGTPLWTTVQTQLSMSVGESLYALDPQRPAPLVLPGEQVRLLAYTAVASGSRGLLFESATPLTSGDLATQQRAMSLELLNLELALIEPWVAGGTVTATLGGSPTEIIGAMLRTDHARLLLPIWAASGAQYCPGQSAARNVPLVVPGVPESCSAFEMVPGELRPLRHKRVSGGMEITLDEFGLTGQVLLTQDPGVEAEFTRRAAAVGPRAAQLQRILAIERLDAMRQVTAELASRLNAPKQAVEWLATARQYMQACDTQFTAHEYQAAYLSAHRAMRAMRLLERAYWEAAVLKLPSPVYEPATVSFATLPWHWKLLDRVAASQPGPNLLPGGDFEDLAASIHDGWQHFKHDCDGVQSSADLTKEARHSGKLGLQLAARPVDPQNPPAMIEAAPLWMCSPAVPVQPGDLVVIHGWVKIPSPLTGTTDGLMVFDSLAGPALAERIGRTSGWRELTLYRLSARPGRMNVTFALTGLGEAWIDDVTINVLQRVARP